MLTLVYQQPRITAGSWENAIRPYRRIIEPISGSRGNTRCLHARNCSGGTRGQGFLGLIA
jgi:hypothetical protein